MQDESDACSRASGTDRMGEAIRKYGQTNPLRLYDREVDDFASLCQLHAAFVRGDVRRAPLFEESLNFGTLQLGTDTLLALIAAGCFLVDAHLPRIVPPDANDATEYQCRGFVAAFLAADKVDDFVRFIQQHMDVIVMVHAHPDMSGKSLSYANFPAVFPNEMSVDLRPVAVARRRDAPDADWMDDEEGKVFPHVVRALGVFETCQRTFEVLLHESCYVTLIDATFGEARRVDRLLLAFLRGESA